MDKCRYGIYPSDTFNYIVCGKTGAQCPYQAYRCFLGAYVHLDISKCPKLI